MSIEQTVASLVYVLFPHTALTDDEELDEIVQRLIKDDGFRHQYAFLLDSFADLCRDHAKVSEIPFERLEQIILAALASEQGPQTRECITKVYRLLAKSPPVFERMLGRTFTDGNEPCPYWSTYDEPPRSPSNT